MGRSSPLAALIVLVGVLATTPAGAEEVAQRWDHRGSVGLFVAGGTEAFARVGLTAGSDLRPLVLTDVGGTLAIGHNGNELRAYGRILYGRPPIGGAAGFGYRGFFGDERFKTFVDVDALMHVAPMWSVGPRLGFGALYELSQLLGLSLGVGAHFGAGATFVFAADVQLGLQLRSYLFE